MHNLLSHPVLAITIILVGEVAVVGTSSLQGEVAPAHGENKATTVLTDAPQDSAPASRAAATAEGAAVFAVVAARAAEGAAAAAMAAAVQAREAAPGPPATKPLKGVIESETLHAITPPSAALQLASEARASMQQVVEMNTSIARHTLPVITKSKASASLAENNAVENGHAAVPTSVGDAATTAQARSGQSLIRREKTSEANAGGSTSPPRSSQQEDSLIDKAVRAEEGAGEAAAAEGAEDAEKELKNEGYCKIGQWSSADDYKLKGDERWRCKEIDAAEHDWGMGDGPEPAIENGGTCTVNCKEGFTRPKHDITEATCVDGIFDPKNIDCEVDADTVKKVVAVVAVILICCIGGGLFFVCSG